MKIYEIGESLRRFVSGEKPPKQKNYVCVFSEHNALQHDFMRMQTFLGADNIISIDNENLSIEKHDAIYTLSHERVFDKKGNKILTPSNILRFLFTRNFTIDTLYRTEDGEVVDMADATRSVVDRMLVSLMPFERIITYDNNVLMEAIYLRSCKSYHFNEDIHNVLHKLPASILPLQGENKWLNKMAEDNLSTALHYIHQYPELDNYINKTSRLKITCAFAPKPEVVKEHEKAHAIVVAQPMPAFEPHPPRASKGAILPGKYSKRTKPNYAQVTDPVTGRRSIVDLSQPGIDMNSFIYEGPVTVGSSGEEGVVGIPATAYWAPVGEGEDPAPPPNDTIPPPSGKQSLRDHLAQEMAEHIERLRRGDGIYNQLRTPGTSGRGTWTTGIMPKSPK